MYKLRKGSFTHEKLYKAGKRTLTQNKGRIFKGCGSKEAVLRYTGSVMCVIEKEYKKKPTKTNRSERRLKTGDECDVKSQQSSVKHEMVKQSMHECCSETKVW